ncbi:AAA family ATPase [Kitasatospora sp. NPDC048365]|uniref:AAA family ATPase n=1 Tax=Kitasatospora sp. NPDC048365 TaxID=3364050 RepID=UPI00371E8C2E
MEGTAEEWGERLRELLVAPVRRVFRGDARAVELAMVCLLAEGHLLVEGLPGNGKTTLAKALAKTIGGTYRRIQFTPDLMPAELTGYQRPTLGGDDEFRKGPLFANVVVADEVNRASPKTQSALLEAMEEHAVSVDGVSHAIDRPFLLIATQNPVDLQGTYLLPEAQLDRFLVRVRVADPDEATERDIAAGRAGKVDDLSATLSVPEVRQAIRAARKLVRAGDPLVEYAVRVVRATRESAELERGASVRASGALVRAVRAHALLRGSDFPNADDVQALAGPVLAHRLTAAPGARRTPEEVVVELVGRVPVPEQLRAARKRWRGARGDG